jgi:ribosomal protein S18 acetylase RimI-like enzyme
MTDRFFTPSSLAAWYHKPMSALDIRPYTEADDADAIALEASCVQGQSLALRFRRSSFAARSAVYDEAAIFCGWLGNRLVGTVAAAHKPVALHSRPLQTTYFYDLRIHPSFRGRGFAHDLIRTAITHMADDAECVYVLVAGQNTPMLGLLRKNYRFPNEVSIPLTYACVPVYRHRGVQSVAHVDPAQVRSRHLAAVRPTFLPAYRPERMNGYVKSVAVQGAGCSIWTNADLLAEEVVRLPLSLRALSVLHTLLRPIALLPEVPHPGEVIRSWFLYDVYAESRDALGHLLDAVTNIALDHQRTVLYLLLPDDDPLLAWVQYARRLVFTFPYRFIARGHRVPNPSDRIYLDVRDL